MFKILKISIILLLPSCTSTPSDQRTSEWNALDHVEALECKNWPLKDHELDLASMTTAHQSLGFMATIRMRNGSFQPAFLHATTLEGVSAEDLHGMPVGRDAHVIAIAEWNRQGIAFVVQNKNDRAWLEVRAIENNQLLSRLPTPLADEVSQGQLVVTHTGWWLQLNHSETDSSYVAVTPSAKGAWAYVVSKYQSHARMTTLLARGVDNSAMLIQRDQQSSMGSKIDSGNDAGADSTTRFKVVNLDETGASSDGGSVTVPTPGGLESWTAVLLADRLVLGLVQGDSMVGQGVVQISGLNLGEQGVSVAWSKKFPFHDVHLGDPTLVSQGRSALFGIVKWIDGEGAFSRIKIDSSGAQALTDIGVLAKGTILAAGYLDADGRGLGAFRYKEKDLWKYKICKLAL